MRVGLLQGMVLFAAWVPLACAQDTGGDTPGSDTAGGESDTAGNEQSSDVGGSSSDVGGSSPDVGGAAANAGAGGTGVAASGGLGGTHEEPGAGGSVPGNTGGTDSEDAVTSTGTSGVGIGTHDTLSVCIFVEGPDAEAEVVLSDATGAYVESFGTDETGCATVTGVRVGDLVTGVRTAQAGTYELRTVSVPEGATELRLWNWRSVPPSTVVGAFEFIANNSPPVAPEYRYDGYGDLVGFPANLMPYTFSARVLAGDLNDSGTLDAVVLALQDNDLVGFGYSLANEITPTHLQVPIDTWNSNPAILAVRGLLTESRQVSLYAEQHRGGNRLWSQGEGAESGAVTLSAISDPDVADRVTVYVSYVAGYLKDDLGVHEAERGYWLSTDAIPDNGTRQELSIPESDMLGYLEAVAFDPQTRVVSYVLSEEASCLGATPTAHSAELVLESDMTFVYWDVTLPKHESAVLLPRLGKTLDQALRLELLDPRVVSASVYAVPSGSLDAVFSPIPVLAPEWAERQAATTALCRVGLTVRKPDTRQ